MEKKTIGKFISALRRANGMTQRELGERLYVSDKTVSRWECDECTPDLSLIPLIAEIFNITADELLRGERNSIKANEDYKCNEGLSAKAEKQFKLMLHNSKKKYDNLSLISIGITIAGLIVAVICNLGFNMGLLGFCLGSIFFIASIICQICFTVNSKFLIDEEENEHIKDLKGANTEKALKTVNVLFLVITIWAFCLPIAVFTPSSYYGLSLDSWLFYGALFALIGFIICYLIYTLFIIKELIEKEIIFLDNEKIEQLNANNKLMKKILIVFISVFLAIMVATYIVNVVFDASSFIKKERFDNPEDFIEFMQNDYDAWFKEGYGDLTDIDKYYTYNQKLAEIDGKEYYYNPDLYQNIFIDEYEDGKFNIVVTTKEAYYNGHDIFDTINVCLLILHIINFIGCAGWYCIISCRKDATKAIVLKHQPNKNTHN